MHLEQAIETGFAQLVSVLQAEGAGWELIGVDDGSTDGTSEELGRTADDDDRILVIRHIRNRGYGSSLKSGIRRPSADWVLVVAPDDSYPIEQVPELLRLLDAAEMVVGAWTATSFTTMLTMISLANGYRVRFVPIDYRARVARSNIRPPRNTLALLAGMIDKRSGR